MENYLLCTDLDRTLLPNGQAPEDPLARRRFGLVAQMPNVSLAYVTGRDIALVEAAIAEYQIPVPDYIIGDVGASIYHATDNGWEPDSQWHQSLAHHWQDKSWQALLPIIEDLKELQLQDNQTDNACPHKLSFFTKGESRPNDLLQRVEELLHEANFNSRIVWSFDETRDCGLLDVLPLGASKYHAIDFIRVQLKLDKEHCFFSGDSGNDLEVLESDIPAVLVANGTSDVRHLAIQNARTLGNSQKLYLAQAIDDQNNGNYASGILQGLEHFFPELYHSNPLEETR